MSILPHEAKVVTIFPLVRYDWLQWTGDKYDIYKKIWVRVEDRGLKHAGCMWPARAFYAARNAFWEFSNN